MEQPHHLPIPEAARVLGLSPRTIERRLAAGDLRGAKVRGRWLVDVDAPPDPRQPDADPARLAVLEGDLREARRHAEDLQRQVDALTQERDYLRAAHAASLSLSQRLLPAPTPTPPPSRPTWWPFRRHAPPNP